MKKTFTILSMAALMVSAGCAKKPATAEAATTQTAQVQNTQATTNSVVKTVPTSVKGADVLQTIAANYKGKVVLFDFWATWCPPCRKSMKLIDEIKPELEKKGCVFVYITGESSPMNTWTEMIKDISGDHYRLTATQWDEMCKALNIPGIPVYLLMGKDGKKAYDNLSEGGYPGNEILKNNIEVALTK